MSGLTRIDAVAFVGFGEAGGILGAALAAKGVRVAMFDLRRDQLRDKAQAAGVRVAGTLRSVLDGAQLVVSAVTAEADLDVAQALAGCIEAGQVCLDINSVSPQTKQHAQACIEGAGARYVEAAVMAPVPPYGLAVPMLLGGADAVLLAPLLNALGFDARAVSEKVGVASAAKMCRSVMIKGIEALTVECLRAARHYDAESIVLASLTETFGKMRDAADVPGYLVSRVAEHGRRRAAEMREVSQTLQEAGITPFMSDASARLQDSIVDAMQAAGIDYGTLSTPFDWRAFFDRLPDSK
ncbi:NAD(P)-dependent oxidoreductase [Paraburkholderia ginsengisoli]|uniref:NAD(P)-dependent oxidoreductase n=2 Tax=Paraburkholderia ginsengisoli TaxID=311231 RepID=A0A7T4TCP5_9BURK|nr:NAD(P)-dependent oxidoreductase [Paraburkholderia ginsengisoli]